MRVEALKVFVDGSLGFGGPKERDQQRPTVAATRGLSSVELTVLKGFQA